MRKFFYFIGFFAFVSSVSLAQTTDSTAVEEDFSAYENMTVQDGSIKTYCTQKVFGQAPSRLIGVGYEHQFGHELATGLETESETDDQRYRFRSASVFRAEANFPIISRNNFIFSLGGIFTQTNYRFKEDVTTVSHPIVRTLDATPLRNFQLNATLFKPFNAKTFLLAQVLGEYAGNWKASNLQPFNRTKYSFIGVLGRKPNDRKMWGLGIARTFRAGELNYIPLFLFNYSSPNLKSGTEILFPAYAYYRYNLSAQSIVRLGMELEGTSFNLRNVSDDLTILPMQHPLELRRSEIKLRALWDVPVKNFWRTQLALGYRIMYRYNVDEEVNGKEMLRLFGILSDAPYMFENKVGSAITVGAIFNLVSP